MKLLVGKNKITLDKKDMLNAGEYNVHEVEFEFDEVYDDLIKKAVFSNTEHSYLIEIVDNKATIPYEVLGKTGDIGIGAFGYSVNGDDLELRYSPSPAYVHVDLGSYKDSYDNYQVPTADVIEQLTKQIEEASQEIQDAIATIDTYDDRIATNTSDIADLNSDLDDVSSQVDTNTSDISSLDTRVSANEGNITNLQTNKADKSEIPTKTSNLINDSGFIDKSVNNLDNYTKTSNLATVATSGSYNDLSNKPTIPDVSSFITKDVNNLTYYTLKTSTGSLIDLEINSSTYVITLNLKDIDGNVISTDTIDLPLESVVVSGSFDIVNKKIVLTLQNGNTVDIPVGDLVAGLQTEITSTNKLNADYVDDINSGNKFTNTSEKTTWNAKYDKPSGGIPSTDLASAVQTSLGKADTALQSGDLTDYVKNTDYATDSKGGAIRVWTQYCYSVGSSYGNLYAITKSYEDYTSAGNNIFISKGTLENVITGKELVNKTYVDGLVGNINTALDAINGEVVE